MSLISVTQPEMRLGGTTTTADKKGNKGRKKSTLIKHNKSTLDITLDSLAAHSSNNFNGISPETGAIRLDDSSQDMII